MAVARHTLTLWVLALACTGCFTRAIAKQMGVSGWYRADVQPKTPDAYRERFEPLALVDPQYPCSMLLVRERDQTSPVVILVHGIGGDGPEMESALSTLMQNPPASIFLFRWVPYESRDEIADRLALGINRIAQCLPESEGRIIVLAHSAGGVVASQAAHQIHLPTATKTVPWVTIFTVASPLAGTRGLRADPNGHEQATLFFDLGTRITLYPDAAPGVFVAHLRTQAPADSIMEPNGDSVPNDPSVGVPGAPQIDLPTGLDHAGSLVYVAGEIAAGRWTAWTPSRSP